MAQAPQKRHYPIGAALLPQGGVHFRVWAPKRQRVEVVLESSTGNKGTSTYPLNAEEGSYFAGTVATAQAGSLYRFRLDGDTNLYPDPASRYQPQGPHGPSQVVDPTAFVWTDRAWRGCNLAGGAVYEMHIGTFTPEGTWQAAQRELPALADLGISVVEVMPVAEFPGRFGWGYDGVDLFAPTRLYGAPDDFRRFVDAAHGAGLGVILDVVYNHIGPDGNYLREFSADYFTDRYDNEWGDAINFDGDNAGPVREFFLANAVYWIKEYHLDGLRLDATQQIFDSSPEHFLAAMTRAVQEAAGGKTTFLVAENESQHTRLVRPPDAGGYGLSAMWNDDFHHAALVAMTGHHDAYYSDYRGGPQEFISALKYGFIFQGQRYSWQKKRRGTPALDLPPSAFVVFLENHDQVANSGRGWRCHQLTSPGRLRALTALTLLGPNIPMLFQGQEFCASAPFLFFADHKADLAPAVQKGRAKFLGQFPNLALEEMQTLLANPGDLATFQRCKLDLGERQTHAPAYALHRDLLHLRRKDPVFSQPRPRGIDGAVLGPDALVLRFFNREHGDRLLIMNLGRALHLDPAPEPLLAPPENARWRVLWSSEHPNYGGEGTPPLDTDENWKIPGEAAVVLVPEAVPAKQVDPAP
jgi:maltooligosyltrehalose trehalohydrolase